jgi:hypothetical protein
VPTGSLGAASTVPATTSIEKPSDRISFIFLTSDWFQSAR